MKQFKLNKDAYEKILSGAQKLCDIVGLTLGPRGRNIIIECENGEPLITNDGVTIAREVIFEDKFENMAAQVLLQASAQTNAEAGDGTTSAIVLATEILKRGYEAIEKGISPILLKQELNDAQELACQAIVLMSNPVKCYEEIKAVATNSCANESDGKLIADAFEKVGHNGVVTIEENNEGKTYIKHENGCEIVASLASPYMIEDASKIQTVYDDAKVIVVNSAIKRAEEIIPILEFASKEKQKTVIIATDFSQEVINMVLVNRVRSAIPVLLVKIGETGDRRNALLEDIAALTNAAVISKENGINIIDIKPEQFGKCKKISCGMESCKIIACEDVSERLNDRISVIKSQIEIANDEYTKIRLRERHGKLTKGISIISIGAPTKVELKERKLRIEDAINAVIAATSEGIVPGGGIAYWDIIKVEELNNSIGAKVLNFALGSIVKKIIENSGEDVDKIITQLTKQNTKNFGYDALGKKFCNMVESNIVDPTKVVKQVIKNAVSAAATLLTTECMIVSS